MFRHGDVLILDQITIPQGVERRKGNVIAEGKATGHAHRLHCGEIMEKDGELFVIAHDNATLTHEEHNRLELPATNFGVAYPVKIQREYDDEQEWRQVAD